jgi:hypothetical protein
MASDERSDKAETGMVPEVANLGIMRPPLVYPGTIALGLLLHVAWPVRLVSRAVSGPLGGTQCLSPSRCSSPLFARFGPLARPFRAIVPCERPLRRSECNHHDRAHGALSLQPQSHLSVFLAASR